MKVRIYSFLSVFVFATILFQTSCEKEGGGERKVSKKSDTESHNMGLNCMSCHTSGGSGEGYFTVAGTVYNSSTSAVMPNSTIELYSQSGGKGKLIETIDVDGKGNFYTTKTIKNMDKGVYPVLKTTSGNTFYMYTKITTGECNSCHGTSRGNIAGN